MPRENFESERGVDGLSEQEKRGSMDNSGSNEWGPLRPSGSHITSFLRFTQIITKIIKYSHEKPVKNPALWVNLYFR